MKSIDDQIAKIDADIARLRIRREAFVDMRALLTGEQPAPEPKATRKRSANVKPLVLDIMKAAGASGHTSAEVTEIVRQRLPTVSKETVQSVLSRLRGYKALDHDGERYYDARYAPPKAAPQPPFDFSNRTVN